MRFLVQPMPATSANMPWLTSGKVYTIASASSGKFVTVRDGQITVEQRTWDEDQAQRWRIEALTGDDVGYYRIVSVISGKVLDITGGSTADGAEVIEWAWHGGPNQQFQVADVGDGKLSLRPRHSTKAIGVAADPSGDDTTDGNPIQQWEWLNGANQQWRLATVRDVADVDDLDAAATLYQHADFSGQHQDVGIGSFRDEAIQLPPRSISSVRVPEGLRVTLFDNPGFRAGTHNRCWGVNDADHVYTRDGVRGSWRRIDGLLTQVSVAGNGRVWGVNANDDIYTRAGVDGAWQHIPGKLKDIAVNASGRVWGVNAGDQIYTRDGVDGTWRLIGGRLKQIDVADDGRVWGVNADDAIYTRAGVDGAWQRIDGRLKQVSVNASGRVWGVNAADHIYTRAGVDGAWQRIDGLLSDVSVANDGTVWGVNSSGHIYTRAGVDGTWQLSEGRLTRIGTSSGDVGRSRQFTADARWVGDDFNDVAESVLVEPVATIYQHTDYDGTASALGVGRYRASELGLPDNSLSSIKVPYGLLVTVFDGPDFDGTARTFTEDAPAMTNGFNDLASSIVVKVFGIAIPHQALPFGAEVVLAGAHGRYLAVDGNEPNAAASSVGSAERFTITRTGPSKVESLLSFGDEVGLRTSAGRFLGSSAGGGAETTRTQPDSSTAFVIERGGASQHNSFVAAGDTVAFRSVATGRYLVAQPDDRVLVDRAALGPWERFVVADPAIVGEAVIVPSTTASPAPGACGAAACGAAVGNSFCGAQAAGVAACAADACGADACAAAACGANAAVVSACAAAAAGIAVCGVDVAVVEACGVAASGVAACGLEACGAAAGGLVACGADACGAAACAAAACGAAACAAAACGADACGAAASGSGACASQAESISACGADACAAEAGAIESCGADACLANACAINACPADACLADACAIDIIPIIPGI